MTKLPIGLWERAMTEYDNRGDRHSDGVDAVARLAYGAGLEEGISECLMAVNDSDFAAESVRAVAKRLGVEL